MSLPDARGSRDGVCVRYQLFFRRSTRGPAAEHPYLAAIRSLENLVPRVFAGLLRPLWSKMTSNAREKRAFGASFRSRCAGKARGRARKKRASAAFFRAGCAEKPRIGGIILRICAENVRIGRTISDGMRGKTAHSCAEKVRIPRIVSGQRHRFLHAQRPVRGIRFPRRVRAGARGEGHTSRGALAFARFRTFPGAHTSR